jgi:hypothetical protein
MMTVADLPHAVICEPPNSQNYDLYEVMDLALR